MTAMRRRAKPCTITVEQGRRTAWLYGPVRVVQPAIRSVGSPWQWDHRKRALSVPIQRVDDVAAAIELGGNVVEIQMPGW